MSISYTVNDPIQLFLTNIQIVKPELYLIMHANLFEQLILICSVYNEAWNDSYLILLQLLEKQQRLAFPGVSPYINVKSVHYHYCLFINLPSWLYFFFSKSNILLIFIC